MDFPGLREHDRIGSNPSVMTIDRQAARGVIVLPISSHIITPLTGFSSVAAQLPGGSPFIESSPFVESSVLSQKLRYRCSVECRGSFLSNQSVKKSRASEHLTVHLGVTVGNDILGGGVSGSYDKAVLDASDSLTVSRRCSFRCGNVALSRSRSSLVLKPDARKMLRVPGGLERFQERYGDFFVSELSIGADAGVCLTMSSLSHDDWEDKNIVAEAHVLFWSDEAEVSSEHTRHHWDERGTTLIAHDTLENTFVSKSWPGGLQSDALEQARKQTMGYAAQAESLDTRVRARLSGVAAEIGKGDFGWDVCRKVWEAGLVAEMVLVPFTTLREIQEIMLGNRA